MLVLRGGGRSACWACMNPREFLPCPASSNVLPRSPLNIVPSTIHVRPTIFAYIHTLQSNHKCTYIVELMVLSSQTERSSDSNCTLRCVSETYEHIYWLHSTLHKAMGIEVLKRGIRCGPANCCEPARVAEPNVGSIPVIEHGSVA